MPAIPIWVADYVLMDYGTGAIMAVPAHDERDFAFAERFELPIVQVVAPAGGEAEEGVVYVAHSENEVLVNSGQYTGLSSPEAKKAIVAALAERGLGHAAVNYRLRDWLLSRQRYWGCPIPMIHCGALRDRPGAGGRPAGAPARGRRLPAEGPLAPGRGRGLGERHLPLVRRRGDAGDRHDGHVRRLVLVLPALHDPARLDRAVRAARSSTTGCRSTSTSAGSSTRSST